MSTIIDYQNIRQNIRILRELKGVSSKEMAAACTLRQQKRIADIEEGRGVPNLEEMVLISRYLGITVDNLINRKAVVSYSFC